MRLSNRFLSVATIVFAAAQFHAGSAQACIKFDRAAEMAAISKAIDARATAQDVKAQLIKIRDDLRALHQLKVWETAETTRHGELMRKGMSLIGKQRIFYREAAKDKARSDDKNDVPVVKFAAKSKSLDSEIPPGCA